MSFVLSGSINQSRVFEFRPVSDHVTNGIGNYIQNLRNLCYNSDGFIDASRVFNRFKVKSGVVKITLYSFVMSDNMISTETASLYNLIGAVRYGKNLDAAITPISVYEHSDWTFPSNIVQVDKAGRYMPYSKSVQIPIKTGFTTFKKCFGNLYNILITLAMSLKESEPYPPSYYQNDFKIALRMEWKFYCVGEGSASTTLDWVPCMHFSYDRRQGVQDRGLTW